MSPDRRHCSQRLCATALLVIAFASAAPAQVLAHPGWTRSNFAADPWYQHAIFYQIRPSEPATTPDFKALAERLDAIQSTGIDALIVTPPALPSLSGASAEQALAAQSALDAFDNFTRQSTARGIRVMAALPAAHADADFAGRVRFWLTRGVAGLRLEVPANTSSADRAAISSSARAVAASAGGQRIVLVDDEASSPSPTPAHAAPARRTAKENAAAPAINVQKIQTLNGPLTAASLRPQLTAALSTRDTLLDTLSSSEATSISSLARALATLALAANPAALIDPANPLVLPASIPTPEPADDETKPAPPPTPPQPPTGVYLPYVPYVPPPRPVKKTALPPAPADPFTEWVAKLAALHHSNIALRTGSKTVLDFDAQNTLVWIAKPATPTPQNAPVVVLCNLSAQPVQLSLADAMKKLNLHGFFLRTLLRSDDAMGAQDIDAVKLAPYAVFIGEVRR